jgi:pantoate--beta-alanine ligase
MRLVRTKAAARRALEAERGPGRRIGLVPTMGYLHDGHASLLRGAREQCDFVVMSVFVNPTQFRPGEDLEGYPRDEERDIAVAEREKVDLIYAPDVAEVYPEGYSTSVLVEGTSEVLCGDAGRRGIEHFRGVTTVVTKLFNTIQPDVAFFGQKDAQQAVVIRRMARDLDMPIEIEVLPTIREPDGLAMSSRNAYLDAGGRRRAPAIHRALETLRSAAAAGETEIGPLLERAREQMRESGIEPEYLEARDAEDLSPVETFNGRPVLVAVAAPVGNARLIDNVVIEPAQRSGSERPPGNR